MWPNSLCRSKTPKGLKTKTKEFARKINQLTRMELLLLHKAGTQESHQVKSDSVPGFVAGEEDLRKTLNNTPTPRADLQPGQHKGNPLQLP